MKKTGFIVLTTCLLCCLPAEAQFGNLIKKGKEAVKNAKEKVEHVVKKAKGDIDFYFLEKNRGFYSSKNHMIVLLDRYKDGELKGQQITYTIMENGDVIKNNGKKIAELLNGGIVNAHDYSPYSTLAANGDVLVDGEVVANIDNNGNVTMEGFSIGNVKGIDKDIASLIFFAILQNKEVIDKILPQYKEERKLVNERKRKAEEERLNREWPIEKNGSKGFVKGNGEVYDWAHNKIGQLPAHGDGDIKDGHGNIIGRIRLGKIYNKMGQELADVNHNTGDITIPGTSNQIAIVRSGNVVLQEKDSMMGFKDVKTLGYCDVRPYEWVAALIYCNFFKF